MGKVLGPVMTDVMDSADLGSYARGVPAEGLMCLHMPPSLMLRFADWTGVAR